MNAISTPDICDDFSDQVRVLDSVFQSYGGLTSFFGEVVTIKSFEDNSVVKQLVGTPGKGRVIVMDGGGSLRRAILGDMLAEQAADNGWSGLVIYGCIRDCVEVSNTRIGVKALNTHPKKTDKRGLGDLNVPVTFAGQTIKPGDWVYCDGNGIVVSDNELALT